MVQSTNTSRVTTLKPHMANGTISPTTLSSICRSREHHNSTRTLNTRPHTLSPSKLHCSGLICRVRHTCMGADCPMNYCLLRHTSCNLYNQDCCSCHICKFALPLHREPSAAYQTACACCASWSCTARVPGQSGKTSLIVVALMSVAVLRSNMAQQSSQDSMP